MKDQVVAVLDLGEEQAMPASRLGPLPRGEEGREPGQPLIPAGAQVMRRQRVSEFLEALGGPALGDGIGTLLEVDALGSEPIG